MCARPGVWAAHAAAEEDLGTEIAEAHAEPGAPTAPRVTVEFRSRSRVVNHKRVEGITHDHRIVGPTYRRCRSLAKQDTAVVVSGDRDRPACPGKLPVTRRPSTCEPSWCATQSTSPRDAV